MRNCFHLIFDKKVNPMRQSFQMFVCNVEFFVFRSRNRKKQTFINLTFSEFYVIDCVFGIVYEFGGKILNRRSLTSVREIVFILRHLSYGVKRYWLTTESLPPSVVCNCHSFAPLPKFVMRCFEVNSHFSLRSWYICYFYLF